MSSNATRSLFVGVFVYLAAPALCHGVVLTNDPAAHEVSPGSAFSMVGYLNSAGGTTGTLIGSFHVLTAAHAVGSVPGMTFTLQTASGPQVYNVVEKSVDASADLAVLTLDRSTGMSGYDLYGGTDEWFAEVAIAGYGVSGIGAPDPGAYPRGTLRAGYNILEYAWGNTIMFTFNAPGTGDSLGEIEGMAAVGDSGAPVFLYEQGKWKIAGVARSVGDANYNGLLGDYGDYLSAVRVSQYVDWITMQQEQTPEPASGLLLLAGVAGILRRRRRRRA